MTHLGIHQNSGGEWFWPEKDLKEVLLTDPKFHLNTTSRSGIIKRQLFQGAVYTPLYTQKVNCG